MSEKINNEKKPHLSLFSVFFAFFALGCVVFAIYSVYSKIDAKVAIVAGDAYNVIIYHIRAAIWVCIGIVSAIISLIGALIDLATADRKQRL